MVKPILCACIVKICCGIVTMWRMQTNIEKAPAGAMLCVAQNHPAAGPLNCDEFDCCRSCRPGAIQACRPPESLTPYPCQILAAILSDWVKDWVAVLL